MCKLRNNLQRDAEPISMDVLFGNGHRNNFCRLSQPDFGNFRFQLGRTGYKIMPGRLTIFKEALINSHMAATVVWRDEMQGVARSQGLFSLTRDATRQFARQTPSHMGCGQIGCSLSCTAWHRSPSYDLRRTRRDLPDLTRNAAHGGINQRFLKEPLIFFT